MYLTFSYSFALHGIGVESARVWFSGESQAAEVSDPDYTLTLNVSRNPSLELGITRNPSLTLNIR